MPDKKTSYRVDQNALKYFEHVKRASEERMTEYEGLKCNRKALQEKVRRSQKCVQCEVTGAEAGEV